METMAHYSKKESGDEPKGWTLRSAFDWWAAWAVPGLGMFSEGEGAAAAAAAVAAAAAARAGGWLAGPQQLNQSASRAELPRALPTQPRPAP
jgi:hypothetical protein